VVRERGSDLPVLQARVERGAKRRVDRDSDKDGSERAEDSMKNCASPHPWLTDAEGRPLACTRDARHRDELRSVGHPAGTDSDQHECELALGATIAWTNPL
jgi:hypothetical protein